MRGLCVFRRSRAVTAESNFAYSEAGRLCLRLLQEWPAGRRRVQKSWPMQWKKSKRRRRATTSKSLPSKGRGQLLDELVAKRGELADCRACMVGLKDDLRTMAVTMEADMQRLLGALSAAAAGQAERIRAPRRSARRGARGRGRQAARCGGRRDRPVPAKTRCCSIGVGATAPARQSPVLAVKGRRRRRWRRRFSRARERGSGAASRRLSQSPPWSGARRQTRAARSVPRLRASSRLATRVSRRCRCRAPSRKSTALRVSTSILAGVAHAPRASP